MVKTIFSFLVFWFCHLVFAQTTVLKDEGEHLLQYGSLSVLEDPTGNLVFQDVEHSKVFIPNTKKTLNYGFSTSAYWLRFQLLNHSSESKWFLLIKYPPLDDIQIYVRQADGSLDTHHLGDLLPFSQRSIEYHHFVASLQMKADEQVDVYIRFKTDSSSQFPIAIASTKEFLEQSLGEQFFFGLYYGSIVLVIFYCLTMFISLRDMSFIYYIIQVVAHSVAMLAYNGLGYQYLWSDWIQWNQVGLSAMMGVSMSAITFFSMYFLQIKQYSKVCFYLLSGTFAYGVLQLFISIFLPYAISIKTASLASLLMPLLLISALIAWRRGHSTAFYFFVAWIVFLLGVAVAGLVMFGVIPSTPSTRYGFQFGSLIEMYLLAFALFLRIKNLNEEKEKATLLLLEENQKRAELSSTFEKFVPKKVLDRIFKEGEKIDLGKAEQDDITILFSDLRNFSGITEQLTAQQLLNYLNFCFEHFAQKVNDHHGIIDKYIGDAIMVIYDFPELSDSHEATAAVNTSVEVLKLMNHFNDTNQVKYGIPIRLGIGIHSGNVIMGTVGSKDRMDSTVIGDAVNVAARLESLTKFYKASILLSEDTYELLDSKEGIRKVDYATLVGKTKPVRIFERMITDEALEDFAKIHDLYHEGLEHYYEYRWSQAVSCFQNCQVLSPQDAVVQILLKRSQQFFREPPSNWNGVYQHSSK